MNISELVVDDVSTTPQTQCSFPYGGTITFTARGGTGDLSYSVILFIIY